jgi:hypothetical protein
MTALRTISTRPLVTVDNTTHPLRDAALNVVGTSGPFGRNRVLSALPLNKSKPVLLSPPQPVTDVDGFLLGDPAGNVIGAADKIVVHRLLYATRTINTRRL